MRNRITDLFRKISYILIYIYSFKQRFNFLFMYYTNTTLDKIKNANKYKKDITSDCKFIINKWTSDSTYLQKIVNCLVQFYYQIIGLYYETHTRLFLKIKCDTWFSKCITCLNVINANRKHMTIKLVVTDRSFITRVSLVYRPYNTADGSRALDTSSTSTLVVCSL